MTRNQGPRPLKNAFPGALANPRRRMRGNGHAAQVRPRKGPKPGLSTAGGYVCKTCRHRFQPRRRGQRFCSGPCRQLAWMIDVLAAAIAAGRAEGLRGKVRALKWVP